MKIAILNDTHCGVRSDMVEMSDYQGRFYEEIFFPYLDQHDIKHIIHMGDYFDRRKFINFASLQRNINHFIKPMQERGITMDLIIGNHDTYYKNTNEVNAVDLLLREYDNVTVYSEATEVSIDEWLNVLFIPWINKENEERTFKFIQTSDCHCAMGHLELNGFRAHRGCVMDHGHESELYSKFTKVFSGHYHTRSDDGRIYYLGNPYEMFWNDVGDRRGFTILDTETLEHFHIDNPYRLFYNVYYEDTPHQLFDATEYANKIVKVIVRQKTSTKDFEKFIDKFYEVGVSDIKVVENFDIQDPEEFEVFESEDTLSILDRYIQEAEINLDKPKLQNIMRSTYQEACELI